MKIHLYRSSRSSWCGRTWISKGYMTRDIRKVTCKTCLKADAAEQRKEDVASQ